MLHEPYAYFLKKVNAIKQKLTLGRGKENFLFAVSF